MKKIMPILMLIFIIIGICFKTQTGMFTIDFPKDDEKYKISDIDLKLSSNDFYHKYSLDGGENITFTPNITLENLSEGKHKIRVYSIGEEWNKTYSGENNDVANSIIQTSDEGYAIFGNTNSFGTGLYDFWVVKINKSGVEEWNKTYGGTNYEVANSIIQTSDEGYILLGFTDSFGEGLSDFWVIKLDSNGEQEWNKTYGGEGDDYTRSIIKTLDTGYLIIGNTNSFGAGEFDFWVVKINETGEEEWNKTYGGEKSDYATSIIQASDGGYIVMGNTESYGSGNSDFWVVKINETGEEEWNKTYGGVNEDGIRANILQTSDGYILAGFSESNSAGNYDFWVVKINETGEEEWNKTYGGEKEEIINSIIQTSDGYILAGEKTINITHKDMLIMKINKNGGEIWNKTFKGDKNKIPNSIILTNNGYILTGFTDSFGAGDIDFWVLKIKEKFASIDFEINLSSDNTTSQNQTPSNIIHKTINKLPANIEIPVTFDLTSINKYILEISLKTNETMYSQKVNISLLDSNPVSTKPSETILSYIEINVSVPEENINTSKIKFAVPIMWLIQNNISKDNISLYEYKNGWKKLKTNYVSKNVADYYFVAENRFSYFAITGVKNSGYITNINLTTPTTPLPSQNDSSQNITGDGIIGKKIKEQEPKKVNLIANIIMISILLLVIITIGLIIYFFLKNKYPISKNREQKNIK
jgi:PGF-pre-PGF domain-containing protein